MSRVPQLDPEQVAVLRRLRAAFGPIEILEVIDRSDNPDQADAQGALVNHEALPKESREEDEPPPGVPATGRDGEPR
jgi:hypothetical protein